MFGRRASPTSVMYLAESGQLSHFDLPTRREPAPMAKRISVVVGFSETIRLAGVSKEMLAPKSSLTWSAVETAAPWRADLTTDPSHARERTTIRLSARDDKRGSPPRGPRQCGRRRGRLLAPGRVARLPDSRQWLHERRVVSSRAKRGSIPSLRSGRLRYCPLQWRGRTGIQPVSVSPVRALYFSCDRESIRRLGGRQARRPIAPSTQRGARRIQRAPYQKGCRAARTSCRARRGRASANRQDREPRPQPAARGDDEGQQSPTRPASARRRRTRRSPPLAWRRSRAA